MVPEYEWVLMGSRELDLITTGRKNGMPRSVELWFGYDNGYVYLLSGLDASGTPTHWYRNLETHPQATLRVKGRDIAVQAEPVLDEEREAVRNRIFEILLAKYGLETMWQWYDSHEFRPVRLRVMT